MWGLVLIIENVLIIEKVMFLYPLRFNHLNIKTLDTDQVAFDLCLLSTCSHSVHTHGTFGTWGSLLAGGQVIAPTGTNPHTKTEVRACWPDNSSDNMICRMMWYGRELPCQGGCIWMSGMQKKFRRFSLHHHWPILPQILKLIVLHEVE